MKLIEALGYQPKQLSFGTSGLRGLVSDMTDLECYINALGFLKFLQVDDGLEAGNKIYIAGDLRDSTPRIMTVMVSAIQDCGFTVVNCGKVPTPTVAYHALINNAPCIMVTGSHIPSDRNGIKFYKRAGEILKDDERGIQDCVKKARAEVYGQPLSKSAFGVDGSLKKLPVVPTEDAEARVTYSLRFTEPLPKDCLRGKKIVVYQHSAVGRDLMVEVLNALGAETIPIERTDTFLPIDTENVTYEEKARFKHFSRKYLDAFAIVSTDGDSDRPFVIDEAGTFYRGDILGCIVAEYLGAKFAATPISSNDVIDQFCETKNIQMVHTKIGSPYVIAAMKNAPKSLLPAVAWEVNGGFITGNDMTFGTGKLRPLPTRDALLPIICALLYAIRKNEKVSEVFAELSGRFTGGGLINDIPLEKITHFKELCTDQLAIEEVIKNVFSNNDLGTIDHINLTDGLRMIFKSGDIMHLRPSGNAPQFRVYTNASSQNQADILAKEAIAEDGYISKLLDRL